MGCSSRTDSLLLQGSSKSGIQQAISIFKLIDFKITIYKICILLLLFTIYSPCLSAWDRLLALRFSLI